MEGSFYRSETELEHFYNDVEMEESSHDESTRIPLLAEGGRHVGKKQESQMHSFFTQTRVEITEARENVAKENLFQAKHNSLQGIASNVKKRQNVTASDIDVTISPPRKMPRLTTVTLSVVGVGSSTVASHKLNASVIDGTFVRKPAKWAKFQQKICALDKLAEFPDKDVRLVRHSKCGREL